MILISMRWRAGEPPHYPAVAGLTRLSTSPLAAFLSFTPSGECRPAASFSSASFALRFKKYFNCIVPAEPERCSQKGQGPARQSRNPMEIGNDVQAAGKN